MNQPSRKPTFNNIFNFNRLSDALSVMAKNIRSLRCNNVLILARRYIDEAAYDIVVFTSLTTSAYNRPI